MEVDLDGDGRVDFEEFMSFVGNRTENLVLEGIKRVRQEFQEVDLDQDGFISPVEMDNSFI